MITQVPDLQKNMVCFRAEGEVSKEDFKIVHADVAKLVEKTGQLNYLLVLDTSLKDFTFGAWLQDILVGIKNIANWNRAAIVTDIEGVIAFTNAFSKVMPGEFPGFEKAEFDAAVKFVSEG
ncbi:MAG: STAS/SEC14 domain-containing protein [Flavobacterium sp.]